MGYGRFRLVDRMAQDDPQLLPLLVSNQQQVALRSESAGATVRHRKSQRSSTPCVYSGADTSVIVREHTHPHVIRKANTSLCCQLREAKQP
uniref:Uncharacterized protein n=1 Tax=Arundo donax TaxID=35708 RepID=A0A0A9CJ61_ARUDO